MGIRKTHGNWRDLKARPSAVGAMIGIHSRDTFTA
jgi:hypothetical protein